MRELFDASAFSPLNSQSLEGTTIASQDGRFNARLYTSRLSDNCQQMT